MAQKAKTPVTKAKTPEKSTKEKVQLDTSITKRYPLHKENYIIMGIGCLIIILGFVALAQPPVDGWISKSLAPVLLMLGFLVALPLGIIWGMWNSEDKTK